MFLVFLVVVNFLYTKLQEFAYGFLYGLNIKYVYVYVYYWVLVDNLQRSWS